MAAAAADAGAKPVEFVVTLSMGPAAPGGERKRLGVDADWGDGKTLYIKSVAAGAIGDWNNQRPASDVRAVRSGDRVVAVNGKTGDAQAMVQECKDSNLLQLTVRRDPSAAPPPGVLAGAAAAAAAGVAQAAGGAAGAQGRSGRGIGGFSAADIIAAHRRTQAEREADLEGAAAAARAAAGFPPAGGGGSAASSAEASRRGGSSSSSAPAPGGGPDLLDHYKVLGVGQGADEAEVKKSYRQLVLRWHPDKHPDDPEQAEVKIRQINVAYETLSNPAKRSSYDQMLAALARRRAGARLDTSFVKPRMSIPKEFMLCPLGHPDHFVRIVGDTLLVQAREELPGVSFKDFFAAAKFSLWWLPEVNNMCRLRAQQTAAQGVDGGVHLMFGLAKDFAQSSESEITLGACQDVRQANVIAVGSPFSQGAFRFEGAFWPGRFLTFRPSAGMLMAKATGDDGAGEDVIDFLLVDYSAAYKYMTVSEVLATAAEGQSYGSQNGFIKLSDLRADLNVRMYFQQMLGCSVWNNKDFETFFEGHYDQWEFDVKKARVRRRTKEEIEKLRRASGAAAAGAARRRGSGSGSDCSELLVRAETQAEVLQVVLTSKQEELERLPTSAFVSALGRLAGRGGRHSGTAGAAPPNAAELVRGKRKMLGAMPRFCAAATSSSRDRDSDPLPLSAILALHRATMEIAESSGASDGAAADEEAREAAEKLVAFATKRVSRNPGSVDFLAMSDLLLAPLDWQAVEEPLREELARYLRKTSKGPGAFVTAIRSAIAAVAPGVVADGGSRGLVEDLARWELSRLGQHQESQAVAEVLLCIAESGVSVDEVVARLRPPLLRSLPLADLVELVAALAELGVAAEVLRPALQTRVAVAGPHLAAVPSQRLLRLAAASTTSPVIAECALGPVASAAASALHLWPLESVTELLLLVATAEGVAGSSGARRLFARAAEVLTPRLHEMKPTQLLRTAVAAGTSAAHCRQLLEAASLLALKHLEALTPEQVLLLTQGVLPLGPGSLSLSPLIEWWDEHFKGSSKKPMAAFPVDDLALLARLFALVAPGGASVFEALGARLAEDMGALSGSGRECVLAAFSGEAPPSFSGRESLLEAVGAAQAAAEAASGPRRKPGGGKDASRSRSGPRHRSKEPDKGKKKASRKAASRSPDGRDDERGDKGKEKEKAKDRDKDREKEKVKDREKEKVKDKGKDKEKGKEKDKDKDKEKEKDKDRGGREKKERDRKKRRRSEENELEEGELPKEVTCPTIE